VQKYLKWSIIGPVALIAAALVAVAWFDVTTGGDAVPKPPIGAEGTPVRYAFVEPTNTPPGAPTATPQARKTAVPDKVPAGTPAERDAKRRQDLLVLFGATLKLRDRDGRFPDTNNNVQSACIYIDRDALCKLSDFLGGPPPEDPFGKQSGYWYAGSPDGQSMRIFASLEGDTPADPKCETTDEGMKNRPNVICLGVP
jgi:hypothetical protein